MDLFNLLLGRPLASEEEKAERIGPAKGVPIFGLDALSSAAYGPEAALTVLIPLGMAGVAHIVPIGIGIVVLLLHRLLLLLPDDHGISAGRRILYRGK